MYLNAREPAEAAAPVPLQCAPKRRSGVLHLPVRSALLTVFRRISPGRSAARTGILAGLICISLRAVALIAEAPPQVRFERLGPFGGTVRSLLISSKDSRVVYLGTSDGQLYRSADSADSWTPIHPGIGRRQLVVDTLIEDPADADHLFAGGWALRSDGGGLFESRDAGRTWAPVRLPEPDVAVRDLAISRGNPAHMIVGTLAGVFLSSDGGRSWRRTGAGMDAFLQAESVAIDPADPRFLFVGTWHLGYRSSDAGKTWIRNDRGMIADSDVFSLAIDSRDSKNMYASACTGLYRSTDRGVSWVRLRVFPKSYLVRAHVVTLDPRDSRRVFGGTTEGLFVSRNAGQTWTRITDPDLIIHAVDIDPGNSNVLLIGTESHGVLRSRDGGRTWRPANAGFVHRSIARIFPDPGAPGRFLVAENAQGKNGALHIFDNPVNGWVPARGTEIPGETLLSILALPGNRGQLAGTARGVYIRRPGSRGWEILPGPIGRLSVFDLAFDRDYRWIFAGTNDGIYRALPEELRFQKPSGYTLIPRVHSLLVPRTGQARVFAGTHMGVLRSDDSGVTWTSATRGIPDYTLIHRLACSPASEDHLFAATTTGLYESRDGGRNWARAADGRLGVDLSSVIFLDASGEKVLAADNASGGIFLSEDAGATWHRLEDPAFGSPVLSLAQDPLHPNVIYLGTGTEGVYRLTIALSPKQNPDQGNR